MKIEKYEFVKPELKDIYNKIVDNNKLQSFLKKIGAIVTIDDYYNSYDLPDKTDKYEIKALTSIKEVNKETILSIANLLLDNNDTIVNLSVNELVNSKFLFENIKEIISASSDEDLDCSVFKEFYYLYKFSYVDNFFQNNWEKFVPEVDSSEINNNKIAKSFVEALMIEFDKINNIINNTKDFKNYKKIPYEYINYLTQLLGFEQLHLSLTEEYEEELRVIAANIIDVYRIRGTISSFELLFNFLGFNVEIIQYYFDRRYRFSPINENRETQESDPSKYRFYLTKNNPADNISDNFPIVESVSDNDFVKPLSFESFDTLVDRYGIDCVLGYNDIFVYKGDYELDKKGKKELVRDNFLDENGNRIVMGKETVYKGPVYSYFLTNVIDIKPSLVVGNRNFSIKQLNILTKLLKFLVPEFWKKHYVVTVSLGEGNNTEKLTVNGNRQTNENGEMLDGFRILDDEDWLYNKGNEYFFDKEYKKIINDSTSEYYQKQEREYKQALINERKNRVLQLYTGNNSETLYVKLNDDTVLQEITQEFLDECNKNNTNKSEKVTFDSLTKDGKVVCTTSEIIRMSNETTNENLQEPIEENIRYFCIINKNGTIEEIKNSPKYLYTNSVGELGPRKGFFEAFTKKLGDNKIKIINSTKCAGALMNLNGKKDENVYKFWKRNSQDGKNGRKDTFWYPPKNKNSKSNAPLNRAELYYPADNELDPLKSYNKIELANFNSMEGQSLRKFFLAFNNATKTKLINLSKFNSDSLEENLIKSKNSKGTSASIISNGIWEQVNFQSSGVLKTLIVLRDIKDKALVSDKYLIAGTLDKFVKKHNVVNYDYINNQLMIGKKIDDEHIEYFDINKCKFYKKNVFLDNKFENKKIPVYGLCYENENNTDNELVVLLKETFDIGSYYLQKQNENNVSFYIVYRLNEPKYINYGNQKLVAYRYKPTTVKYNASMKIYNKKSVYNKAKADSYAALIERNINDSEFVNLNKFLKIGGDSGTVSILSKQPTEYRVFSYNNNSIITYAYENNEENYSPSPYIKMTGGFIGKGKDVSLEEQLNEFNNKENVKCGDFYFNFSILEDKKTSSNFDNIENVTVKRTKKIIAKKSNCLKNELYYYNGNVYKTIFNNMNVFNNSTIICDKLIDVTVTEKKYFGIEETNSAIDKVLTPGIEGANYILDEKGNLVPGKKIKTFQYSFSKKEISDNKETNLFISGLKPITLKGKVEKSEDEYYLYNYDNKYYGISEEEDIDNYILNNNKRSIKWDVTKGVYKKDQGEINNDHEFNCKEITRPIREVINQSFDNYTKAFDYNDDNDSNKDKSDRNRKKFLRNIFEEMLGNTASLNIVVDKIKI